MDGTNGHFNIHRYQLAPFIRSLYIFWNHGVNPQRSLSVPLKIVHDFVSRYQHLSSDTSAQIQPSMCFVYSVSVPTNSFMRSKGLELVKASIQPGSVASCGYKGYGLRDVCIKIPWSITFEWWLRQWWLVEWYPEWLRLWTNGERIFQFHFIKVKLVSIWSAQNNAKLKSVHQSGTNSDFDQTKTENLFSDSSGLEKDQVKRFFSLVTCWLMTFIMMNPLHMAFSNNDLKNKMLNDD